MNADLAKQKLIAWLNTQVGNREGANNWNKYAEELDKIDGLFWGKKQNQPWCGIFELAAFVECFGVDIALEMLYSPKSTAIPVCKDGADYFKKAGQWFNGNPQVGDVIFFNVNGGINHCGIVTVVGMGAITTVEGNSSDMVARRTYAIGSAQIAGYGRPNWALAANCSESTNSSEGNAVIMDKPDGAVGAAEMQQDDSKSQQSPVLPTLQRGSTGLSVVAAQGILIARKCRCGPDGADGDFGYNTLLGVLKFQSQNGLVADGVIGPVTWAALLGVTV